MASDDLAALGRNQLEDLVRKLRVERDAAVAETWALGTRGDELQAERDDVRATIRVLNRRLDEVVADAERAWKRVKLLEARSADAVRRLEGRSDERG